MTALHTLTFREDGALACMSEPEVRLAVAAELMARIGAVEADAVLALPAGFVQAESTAQRDEWAEGLLAASRDGGVGIVFGIDVTDEESWGVERCPRSFAFACGRGRRLLWASASAPGEEVLAERIVTFGALRTVVLLGRELFQARPVGLVASARPELVLVLGHGGPTKKWLPRLAALDAVAPTLLVHQPLPLRRPVPTPPPRGWQVAVKQGPVGVISYRREALGTALSAVGN